MSETNPAYDPAFSSHVVHHNPDMVESVKVEKNTKGFNFEVKAATVARAMEIIDELVPQLKAREGGAA